MALVPLYRLRNGGNHFYTASPGERDTAVSTYGYVYEGIACYVHDAPGAADDQELWEQCFVAALGGITDVTLAAHLADTALARILQRRGG